MKANLMIAALFVSASVLHAGPPMTPAKVKRPLRISQVKSIFHHSEPSAPSVPAAPAQGQQGSTAVTTPEAPVSSPVSKKVHVRTFLNHPVTAPGPK